MFVIYLVLFFCFTASNLLRLSYQGPPASCSVLVDENGGAADSMAAPKSSNRSKTSENTGRWRAAEGPARARRSKRSYLDGRPPPSPPDWLDGGAVTAVHDGNGFTLGNARPLNNALPQQMYDAMTRTRWEERRREPVVRGGDRSRGHRKRQAAAAEADIVVYRNSDAPDDGGDEAVDIVPLDTEHRIRVNLTIASDDDPERRSPVYSVSLSLPGAQQRRRVEPEEIGDPTDTVSPQTAQQQSAVSAGVGGTECECFCPCLEQDDDDDGGGGGNETAVVLSTTPDPELAASSTFSTTTNYYYYSTASEPPEPIGVTCPPPVLLFCDSGKYVCITLRR